MTRFFVRASAALLVAIAVISHLFPPNWAGTIIPTLFVWIPCLLVLTGHCDQRILGLRSPTRAQDGPALLIGCLGVSLYGLLMWWLGDGPSLPSPGLLGTIFVHQCLIVALPEEFFFRGYIQGNLRESSSSSSFRPVILSAVLFALAHGAADGNPTRLVTIVPGLLFGYLRHRTGTIWTPVVIHACANTIHHVFPLF